MVNINSELTIKYKFSWSLTILTILLFGFASILALYVAPREMYHDHSSFIPIFWQKLLVQFFGVVSMIVTCFTIYKSIKLYRSPLKLVFKSDCVTLPISLFETAEVKYIEIKSIQGFNDLWMRKFLVFTKDRRYGPVGDFFFSSSDYNKILNEFKKKLNIDIKFNKKPHHF